MDDHSSRQLFAYGQWKLRYGTRQRGHMLSAKIGPREVNFPASFETSIRPECLSGQISKFRSSLSARDICGTFAKKTEGSVQAEQTVLLRCVLPFTEGTEAVGLFRFHSQ